MLNCKDTCSSKTIKMGADVKEDKQMILKNLIQEIYNLLESLLEARQDPLGCLNSWIMRTIQFILKFTYIQKAECMLSFSLPGLMQLCTDRCFAQLQMWWGVLAVLSWQSRKSQSWRCRCVTGAADHLSAAWAACALWDAPCKARYPPGQLSWAHPRLLQCCGKLSCKIPDLEYFNLWVQPHPSSPEGFLGHILASGESAEKTQNSFIEPGQASRIWDVGRYLLIAASKEAAYFWSWHSHV